MTRPPVELVERLRLARERGESFWDAWPTAVMLTTHSHRGGVAWRDVFSETRFTWERAYAGLPASGPERAAGELLDAIGGLGDEVVEPVERRCAFCGGMIEGRSPRAKYCRLEHEREAAYKRRQLQRAAAHCTDPDSANSRSLARVLPGAVAA